MPLRICAISELNGVGASTSLSSAVGSGGAEKAAAQPEGFCVHRQAVAAAYAEKRSTNRRELIGNSESSLFFSTVFMESSVTGIGLVYTMVYVVKSTILAIS